LAKDLGITKPLNQYAVLTAWKDIVGEQIAKVTTAERIVDGVLIIRVSTAPWRAELSLRRAEILEKVTDLVGRGIVREIRFR
jgi:predicted nucleic acid-binding Zn ribbon protein